MDNNYEANMQHFLKYLLMSPANSTAFLNLLLQINNKYVINKLESGVGVSAEEYEALTKTLHIFKTELKKFSK